MNEKDFYVSNKLLYEEYVKWYEAIEVAKEEGIEEPQIPPYIVDAMMKISRRLSYKPNFINYPFKEEMIGDALIDCIRFAKRFKKEYTAKDGTVKQGNPFSYITTICFNAFLRRIDKEKTERYVKASLVYEMGDDEFLNSPDGEDGQYVNSYIEFLRDIGYNEDSAPMAIKRAKIKKANKTTKGRLSEFEVDE